MENQHRKISGYRELDADEIALMNEVKAMGVMMENTIMRVKEHLNAQHENPTEQDRDRLKDAGPGRWVSISQTHFQEGLMALTRAIAKPTSF